jgi:hypothetical protein
MEFTAAAVLCPGKKKGASERAKEGAAATILGFK